MDDRPAKTKSTVQLRDDGGIDVRTGELRTVAANIKMAGVFIGSLQSEVLDLRARVEERERDRCGILTPAEIKNAALDRATEAVKKSRKCFCDPAWTQRDLHAPDCAWMVCQEAAEDVHALKENPDG